MNKNQYRENAFLLLFESAFQDSTPEELFALAEETGEIQLTEKIQNFVKGVMSQTEELDKIITAYSRKRSLNRIATVNKVLLRMAIYELQTFPDLPVSVVISEAVRISEVYATPEDTAFINGVLGSYARNQQENANHE